MFAFVSELINSNEFFVVYTTSYKSLLHKYGLRISLFFWNLFFSKAGGRYAPARQCSFGIFVQVCKVYSKQCLLKFSG